MRIIFYYLFFGLTCSNTKAQVLHHQSFSSQGKNVLTSSGFVVSQSIGQQSPSGTFKNSQIVVQQGFQQNVLTNYGINSNISFRVYPNPFFSNVNFEFTSEINEDVEVSFFDLLGRLVYKVKKKPLNNFLTIDSLDDILYGQYIVVLTTSSYKSSVKLIKINKL